MRRSSNRKRKENFEKENTKLEHVCMCADAYTNSHDELAHLTPSRSTLATGEHGIAQPQACHVLNEEDVGRAVGGKNDR